MILILIDIHILKYTDIGIFEILGYQNIRIFIYWHIEILEWWLSCKLVDSFEALENIGADIVNIDENGNVKIVLSEDNEYILQNSH